MSQYILSRRAVLDLLQIWNYLAETAGFDVADRVTDDIRLGILHIAAQPILGHTRSDVADPTLRFYRVHSYLVAYLPDTRPLQIVHIVHGARDFSGLFGQT